MIHHVSLGTNDVARARTFYDAVLPIVGLTLMKARDRAADYGSGHLIFSIETPVNGKPSTVGNGSHVAFMAEDRTMVSRFYEAALANGGSSDGERGAQARIRRQLLRRLRPRPRQEQDQGGDLRGE